MSNDDFNLTPELEIELQSSFFSSGHSTTRKIELQYIRSLRKVYGLNHCSQKGKLQEKPCVQL